jgi:glycosyltransferase involved in cell wall biosynthesis
MIVSLYSTHIIDTPPKKYGGLESICYLLARYLNEQGHEVNLFATRESYHPTKGHLFAAGAAMQVNPVAAWKGYWDFPQSREALKSSDIVCSMDWDYAPYSVPHELKRLCHVHHGPNPGIAKLPPMPQPNLIAVSFNHAKVLSKFLPGSVWRAVENGIDLEKYPFKKEKGEYLLFVGRLFYPKGPHRFIDICEKMQIPGKICGGSFGDFPDYRKSIEDQLAKSKYVTVVGGVGQEVTHEQKVELYQNAKAVIQPSIEDVPGGGQFIEPFGLIVPEANACGTPTVVLPSGGWNETTIHGFNGFFANTDDEFMHFIRRIDEIQPEDCRKMAERFDYKIMGKNYVKLFEDILAGRTW